MLVLCIMSIFMIDLSLFTCILRTMNEALQDQDREITAIAVISTALAGLADTDARRRVLSYVLARYLPELPIPTGTSLSSKTSFTFGQSNSNGEPLAEPPTREIPGIACINDVGELKITARELKAKSGLDAAVRLACIAIYAHEKLTGQPISSSKVLTPILRAWRLYDGNTRARLAKERGIIRSGDTLSLDVHARLDAERFIKEILDPEVEGQWKPPR